MRPEYAFTAFVLLLMLSGCAQQNGPMTQEQAVNFVKEQMQIQYPGATIQVMAEALGRSLPEQGLYREKVKLALEGFKNFVTGGLTPPLTISRKDHRPSVESRIFIIKDGKISRYTEFISIGR
jgi:hypothetical protein